MGSMLTDRFVSSGPAKLLSTGPGDNTQTNEAGALRIQANVNRADREGQRR